MKYAELLGTWLVELGYTHCFFVAGGGIMHLLDAFRTRFECIPVVHEMSAGICAEHFNQCSNGGVRAFALVTTGPGLTNIVTAVAGCYVEHRELLVLAGQVKSIDLLRPPERQRGVQEVNGSEICRPIAVRSECLREPLTQSAFVALVNLAEGPHPGPVVIEVCLDVQGAQVEPEAFCDNLDGQSDSEILPTLDDIEFIAKTINEARRPLVLLGGLVTRKAAWQSLPTFEKLGLPVATTTSAIDRLPTKSVIFAGRPGTWGGQRAANIILAQADVVIALGAQLDLQQTGFNFREYAPAAKLIHVFPSECELERVGPPAARKILASADSTLAGFLPKITWCDDGSWGSYVREIRESIPPLEPSNSNEPDFINSFLFLRNLSRATSASDVLALCSSGGAFTGALQNYELKHKQIATTSAAHASMGYGLATAIGAAFSDRTRRVVLAEGEGGFSQNLQELAVIKRFNLPIKIFLIDNGGYASIRATQKKFFKGAYLGCDPETGLAFPNWTELFGSFDIPCRKLEQWEVEVDVLTKLLNHSNGPEAWIVPVDPNQSNWPAVSTIINQDGSLISSPLYDMLPKLPNELLTRVGLYLPKK